MHESRKSIRLPLTATVKIIHDHGVSFYGHTRDISREGIGLYSCSALEGPGKIRLEIAFKDIWGKSRIEAVHGEIAWTYKWNWVYVLGVRFTQILNHEETPALLEYIERCERLICEDIHH